MAETEIQRQQAELKRQKGIIEHYAEALAKGRQLTFSQHDEGDLILIEEQKKEIAKLKKEVKFLGYDVEEAHVIIVKAKRRNEDLELQVS